MNKFILLLPVIAFSITCYSQEIITKQDAKGNAKEYFDRADNVYTFGKLELADSLANMAVKEKDNFIDAWLLIAEINLEHLRRYDVALAAFQKSKLLHYFLFHDTSVLLFPKLIYCLFFQMIKV